MFSEKHKLSRLPMEMKGLASDALPGTPLSDEAMQQGKVLTQKGPASLRYEWDTGGAIGRFPRQPKDGRWDRLARLPDRVQPVAQQIVHLLSDAVGQGCNSNRRHVVDRRHRLAVGAAIEGGKSAGRQGERHPDQERHGGGPSG